MFSVQDIRATVRKVAVIGFALTIAGCSSGEREYAPVSGTVTLNGQPVGDARVMFVPVEKTASGELGSISYGVTDADGNFLLATRIGKDGAAVGRNYVWISTRIVNAAGDQEQVQRAELIPARFNAETDLTFEVPSAGTDAADFLLDSR